MNPEWLKFKKYPHIGEPLTKVKDAGWIRGYVTNPDNITNHKFVPLLHRTLYQRKYRPLKAAPKNSSGKRKRTVGDKKERYIFYASHLDSIIYGYYSHCLTIKYEEYLRDKPYGVVPVAYRKIPLENGRNGNKSNIEFALEAFKFIESNKHRCLSIIVADITSFFDNLDHRILHKQWKKILEVNSLPDDHYAVYKNLVSKKYVNENEMFNRFRDKLIIERYKPHDTSKRELKRKKVKKIFNLRRESVAAYCTNNEFFQEATDLIRVDKPFKNSLRELKGKEILKGIPQGTPISATLANVYMLDFDERINREASDPERNAYYQRYSDDLIIICDQSDEDYFYQLMRKEIEVRSKLDIQPKKTKIYRYNLDENSKFAGGLLDEDTINRNKQLEYLGFVYNGKKVFVKTAGFSRFYRKMRKSFKRGAHFAGKAHIPSDSLFETRLYKRFTHRGSKRRQIWLPDPENPLECIKSTRFDWGNFISYLNPRLCN